jgi:hypothetical protein
MANHAESWAPAALMRFRSLHFIVTITGDLEQI